MNIALQTTSSDRNKLLVAAFYKDVFIGHDLTRLDDFVTEGYIQHNPHLPNGRTAMRAFLSSFYQKMPECQFTVSRLIADDDLVVAHTLFQKNREDRGTAIADIFRIVDGRIAEHWDVKEDVPETSANGNPVV